MVKDSMVTKKKLISKEDVKLLKRSLSYIKEYKLKFFVLLFSIITIIILGIFQPLLWGKILEDITKGDYSNIKTNLLGLLLIYVFQALITLIRGYSEALLNNSIIYDLKSEMYLKILNLSMNVFDRMKIGEFISRLQGDVFTLANIITNQLVTAIVNVLKVIILGVTIFKINVILSLIVLASFPLSCVLFLTFGKRLRIENKELSKINDKYFSFLQQSLLGIKHIKTYGIKNSNYKKFNEHSLDFKNKQSHITLIQILSQSLSMILNSFSDVVLIGVSIYFIMSGKLSVQYFVAFASYSGQFSQSLTAITQLNSNIQQVLVSLERIFGLLDNFQFSNETFGSKDVSYIKGDVEFNNVFFSYNKEKEVLRGTSFKAEPGKLIAIIGNNGCGKSTVFNLLLGLYKGYSGEILIDGISIQDLSEDSLRNSIAIVHQHPFIFNLSIKENFAMNCPNITKKQIEEACEKVHMHEYIKGLEKGYDAEIKENANNLSGGQKQRLALAICLCRNTPIILLDEVTSALDVESKVIVDSIIKELSKSKTIMAITHNTETISSADEIVIIEEGKVIGQGTHNQLLNTSKAYKNLYKHKFYAYEEVSAEVELHGN